ncbi:hypothetical protein GGI24_007091 [Coemansia furcata]|nr:hypothetical protein GGI24_007091 [Coemansia furcata]
MSTPPDSRPPSSLQPAKSAAQSNLNTARIGRVAALSQNFERQQQQQQQQQGNAIPHRITIPMRPESVADQHDGHGVVASAPLSVYRADFGKPVVRSTSISSSHSTGAHGQSTKANRDDGSEPVADAADSEYQSQQQHEDQPHQQPSPPPPPPASGDVPPGGFGAGESGDGNGGGDEPSPNPRAMTLEATTTDSNGSTTSHNSSLDASRGLAGSAQSSGGGLSAALLLDSHASADIGSSIFSSTESGKDAPAASTSRRDAEVERKSRFRELANRRKSGTLERISNSGVGSIGGQRAA